MNLKALNFFSIVNYRLEYRAIDDSSILIYIFSFNKFINLSGKAFDIEIGFKFQSAYRIVKMTIGATIFGLTHLIWSDQEAKAIPYLKNIYWNLFFLGSFKNSSFLIFNLVTVSSIKLCLILLISVNLHYFLIFLIWSLEFGGNCIATSFTFFAMV